MAKNAFILRMKPSGIDRVEEGLASDELIIGWSHALGLLDPALAKEDFRRIIQSAYHAEEQSERKSGQAAPHLWRFIREMSSGDLDLPPAFRTTD